MSSSFSGYNIARQGIAVSRAMLEITGQNIANQNTVGYTRQRVDISSIGSLSGNSQYVKATDDNIGSGVSVDGFSQIRDDYLDVQYRRENALYGNNNAKTEVLNEIGYVYDDAVAKTLNDQLSEMVTQLEALSHTPIDVVKQDIVKNSAVSFAQLLNKCAGRIESSKKALTDKVKDGSIVDVNNYLASIAELNKTIKSANISGNKALELNDQRNTLIDKLSNYMNISVSTKQVDVGSGVMVDELNIDYVAPNGDSFALVDNGQYARLETLDTPEGLGIQLYDFNDQPVTHSKNGSISIFNGDITGTLEKGALAGYINTLNDQGQFGNPPSEDHGLPYYQKLLDTFANVFAKALNDANSTTTEDKPLFEATDGSGVITASNIAISDAWLNSGTAYITATKQEAQPGVDNSNDNTNILQMISLFEQKYSFATDSGTELFNGDFDSYLTNIATDLGMQISDAKSKLGTTESCLNDIETQRDSVSGVNVDDEVVNLIMYNQSLSASSRFMTTMDEAIETIINKMGLVGR